MHFSNRSALEVGIYSRFYRRIKKQCEEEEEQQEKVRELEEYYYIIISCIECSTRFSNNSYKMSFIENEYTQTSDCSMSVFDGNFTYIPHIAKN